MIKGRGIEVTEFLGRAGIAIFFSFAAAGQAMAIVRLFGNSPAPDNWLLMLLNHLASLMFLCLVIVLAMARLKPSRKAEGIEPRLTAMAGTYLLLILIMIDRAPSSEASTAVGVGLVALGSALSAYVLAWLGKSFSIMAEARRLVTGGPYAIVRHPLYMTEAIAALGIVVLHWSPIAVMLFVVQCCLQLRRMRNEEKVLGAAFPEYAAYAERTPQWIPALPGWRRQPV